MASTAALSRIPSVLQVDGGDLVSSNDLTDSISPPLPRWIQLPASPNGETVICRFEDGLVR
jgi:hypothetical protein